MCVAEALSVRRCVLQRESRRRPSRACMAGCLEFPRAQACLASRAGADGLSGWSAAAARRPAGVTSARDKDSQTGGPARPIIADTDRRHGWRILYSCRSPATMFGVVGLTIALASIIGSVSSVSAAGKPHILFIGAHASVELIHAVPPPATRRCLHAGRRTGRCRRCCRCDRR